MNKTLFSLISVAIIAVITYFIRSLAFIAFPKGKEIPMAVRRLSNTLPYGIMGLLVVYCLKDTSILLYPYGLPELISVALVVGLHAWKRNSLFSVLAGTVCYMILIRAVF